MSDYWTEFASDLSNTRESAWLKKLNDDYKQIVDAVHGLEICVGYREYVRHRGDPDKSTMAVQEADRDVRLARGKLFVALYKLTGEQISK
jgi:hypothetical protein